VIGSPFPVPMGSHVTPVSPLPAHRQSSSASSTPPSVSPRQSPTSWRRRTVVATVVATESDVVATQDRRRDRRCDRVRRRGDAEPSPRPSPRQSPTSWRRRTVASDREVDSVSSSSAIACSVIETITPDHRDTAPKQTCSVLFFSRPRSEGWPHHGRPFFVY